MRSDYVQIDGEQFVLGGKPVLLRGYTFGSWMNLEHFMIGLPGTHTMIREAFADVYGAARAEAFFDALQNAMVDEDDVRFLKQMGTNTVRIPFGYRAFIDDSDPDRFLEHGFAALDRAVKLCEKHQLRVILDLHTAPGGQNNDWHADNLTGQSMFWRYATFQRQVCALWAELARRYADDPWIVGYDVLNEPGYDLTKQQLCGFYTQVIRAIRAVDPDHVIFLEGEDFGRSFELLDEPDDPQVTFAVHFYPFVLDEDVLDPRMDDARRTEIYERIFYRQLKVRQRFHRPIWCGESGYNILDGQEDFYARLLLKNILLCEQNGLSWSLWTYKDARRMGVVIPRADSPWMDLRRRLEAHWTHEWEQATSMKLTRAIGRQYDEPMSDALAYDLDFRVRSIMHTIAVEQILKPTLRTIPWEELQTYPDSFRFASCDRRTIVIDEITRYIKQAGMD